MKTTNGWKYFCRVCWNEHIIPYSVLSDKDSNDILVYLKCPKTLVRHYICPAYEKDHFKEWTGSQTEYEANLVEPFSIEKKSK